MTHAKAHPVAVFRFVYYLFTIYVLFNGAYLYLSQGLYAQISDKLTHSVIGSSNSGYIEAILRIFGVLVPITFFMLYYLLERFEEGRFLAIDEFSMRSDACSNILYFEASSRFIVVLALVLGPKFIAPVDLNNLFQQMTLLMGTYFLWIIVVISFRKDGFTFRKNKISLYMLIYSVSVSSFCLICSTISGDRISEFVMIIVSLLSIFLVCTFIFILQLLNLLIVVK